MEGYSLVSQQIRGLIQENTIQVPETDLSLNGKGWFIDEGLEGRIQPTSFEPTLGNEIFILDTERIGLFRPKGDESVYRTLLQLPLGNRMKVDITGGHELRRGHTYLIPLNEKINFSKWNWGYIKSSPKSSTGRVFPKTRLLVDNNNAIDEVRGNLELGNKNLDMWLIVQPLPFDLIVHPGLSLNQLRFFNGDARLTPSQIKAVFDETPLLYNKDGNPLTLRDGMANDGLQLTLDLEGINTQGVVGLRARKINPGPIDLSKKDFCTPEEFFEPLISTDGRIMVESGQHYLFSSKEVVKVPSCLSAELKKHHHAGVEGRTHDAGFVDPGFFGDLVFELSPEELKAVLEHGMPLSTLDFFRTSETPDKIYGEGIGSHYQSQTGPKISKHFRSFDFKLAAKSYAKLDRLVLVQDARILMNHRTVEEGFEFMDANSPQARELFKDINNGFFSSRYDCEEDRLVLQVIPYVLVFGEDGAIFSYVRASKIEDYGDKRLFGKHSIGVGGHIRKDDEPDFAMGCLERELKEEILIKGSRTEPRFVGTLFSRKKPVDEVHFGLIYTIHNDGIVIPNEKSIEKGEMVPIAQMCVGYYPGRKTETWTGLLIPSLKEIYEFTKQ